jgi:uncharacterized protein
MTPQEQKMLDDLMARVDSTRLDDKDPEAAQRIEEWTARNPDAAYILAQTVLVQNYALEQAKAQIQNLQQHIAQNPALPQPSKPASFLGGLFGHKDESHSPQAVPAYAQPQPQQGYAPVPQYAAPQQYGQAPGYPPPGYGTPQGYAPGGGGSSFLRSAATTAAGVAAGALAFQGIESLMHGFGHTAGFGGFEGGGLGSGLGGFGGRPEETTINNYYDSSAPGQENKTADIQQFAHEGDSSLNTQQDLADDVNVDNVNVNNSGDAQVQADTDLPTLDDDTGSYDDASLDDGGSFDDSSFDNS